jgi:hypothetical protein
MHYSHTYYFIYLQFGEFSFTRAMPHSVFENDLKKALAAAGKKK